MPRYRSDVQVGDRYRDAQTGLEGTCVSLVFFQHGCERACIETLEGGDIKEHYLDAARLVHVDTDKRAKVKVPGGGSNPPSRSRSR